MRNYTRHAHIVSESPHLLRRMEVVNNGKEEEGSEEDQEKEITPNHF